MYKQICKIRLTFVCLHTNQWKSMTIKHHVLYPGKYTVVNSFRESKNEITVSLWRRNCKSEQEEANQTRSAVSPAAELFSSKNWRSVEIRRHAVISQWFGKLESFNTCKHTDEWRAGRRSQSSSRTCVETIPNNNSPSQRLRDSSSFLSQRTISWKTDLPDENRVLDLKCVFFPGFYKIQVCCSWLWGCTICPKI